MSEDRSQTHDPAENQESREDYVAPALKDLGSFKELTEFNPGVAGDTEGTS
jgi:hypothetical protein